MKRFYTIAALILVSIFYSCERDQVLTKEDKEKEFLFSIMNDIYFWYSNVPQNINSKPLSLFQYFDTLLVDNDRWSWMMTGEDYISMQSGIYKTYGASFAQPIDYYNDYSVRVRYVFANSPMSENGVKRGYELTHLNGTPVENLINNGTINNVLAQNSNNFTFKDLNGIPFSFTASSRVVSTRSVLKSLVFTPEDFPGLNHNVGYLNYYTFNSNMLSDIDDAINLFNSSSISDLILDLRYNGGGDGESLKYLASRIAPTSANGQILASRKHNNRYSSWDGNAETTTLIQRVNGSLNLNRIFIITGKGTASASEVIINGLDPLTNIITIGRTTYGKPNGMYVIPYPKDDYDSPDHVFLPISFYNVNKLGFGDYEDGLVPDQSRADDLYHDFGKEEDLIKSALTFIATGSFPSLPIAQEIKQITLPGRKLTTDEDKPNYGRFTIINTRLRNN